MVSRTTFPVLRDSAALASNPDLLSRLGAAAGPERSVHVVEQSFQGGAMLLHPESRQILVLMRSSERWQSFTNTWRRGEVLAPAGSRPLGTYEPLGGFGKVWREQPAVRLELGWPVYEERFSTAAVQSFEHGSLLRSAYGVVYALFSDSTWRSLPDAGI
jgi:hypothetical protein